MTLLKKWLPDVLAVLLFAVLALSVTVAFAANPGTVKIAHFKEVISPEVGAKICGYDADQVSVTKHRQVEVQDRRE